MTHQSQAEPHPGSFEGGFVPPPGYYSVPVRVARAYSRPIGPCASWCADCGHPNDPTIRIAGRCAWCGEPAVVHAPEQRAEYFAYLCRSGQVPDDLNPRYQTNGGPYR